MVNEVSSEPQATTKAPRDRSPSYPFISLKTAVERLAAFEGKFGRHPTPADKAGLAWGMKEKSSQAFQTLATLKSFGLVEYQGSGSDRAVSVTTDGRNYLRAQQESIKAEILKRCALKPKAIATYWKKWGADRPIDAICLDELILKAAYTESAAATFLRVYDETVTFASLQNGDTIQGEASDEEDNPAVIVQPPKNAATTPPKVGDVVQWESNGVLQFTARRILGLSTDGAYAFVEGSATGLPVKEITVIQQAATLPQGMAPPPMAEVQPTAAQKAIGTKQDTFTLDEGPVVLQWPSQLSETSYEDFKDWIELQLRKIKRSIQ
jgi:hypothetical protein